MSKRYFGTDGIRGRVGAQPMSPDFVLRLGQAVGGVLTRNGPATVLIGKDTRISGYMFESALEAGLSAAGVNVKLLGPMPTPGVAYLTKTFRASAGVVISASPNPFEDNGVKFFTPAGGKLSDEMELAIERALDSSLCTVESAQLGKVSRINDAQGRYVEFCKSTLDPGVNLKDMKIALDCAHGATYQIAPHVFSELGADVVTMGVQPDGLNINDGCGSTHPQALQNLVRESGADLGVALDGDGDRALLVDGDGRLVDGDEMLFIIATAMKRANRLRGPVVGTLMSNLGLELALRDAGIDFVRAAVGDRFVLEKLREHDGVLGGEPSGHGICLDRTSTGDGIVASLQVLGAMIASGRGLADLTRVMGRLPQVLINVKTTNASAAMSCAEVREVTEQVQTELGARGRVVLRPSGTEPLVRIMVEGQHSDAVRGYAERIASVIRSAL